MFYCENSCFQAAACMSDHFLGLNFIIRGLFVSKSVYEFRVNLNESSVSMLKIQGLKGYTSDSRTVFGSLIP